MEIIGQEKLKQCLNKFSIDTFPHSTILLGTRGCGKHLFANMIASDILKLNVMDITSNISYEFIEEIYQKALPAVYLIDGTVISEKQQNAILKFIEEPLQTCYVIILCENKTNLLNTVLNRCQVFEFEQYKKNELEKFLKDDVDKELVLNICNTPGKLLNISNKQLKDCYNLCNTIIDKMSVANYANTLTISDKINYKDNYDKFDVDTFFDTMVFALFNKSKVESNKNILPMYLSTIEHRKQLRDKRLNKQYLIENYLTDLWKIVRRV